MLPENFNLVYFQEKKIHLQLHCNFHYPLGPGRGVNVMYDQELFEVKLIVEYAQINDSDTKINQTTCEVSGFSEISFVCSELQNMRYQVRT